MKVMELRSHHSARTGTRDKEGTRHRGDPNTISKFSDLKSMRVQNGHLESRATLKCPALLSAVMMMMMIIATCDRSRMMVGAIVGWTSECSIAAGTTWTSKLWRQVKAPRCKPHAPVGRTPDGNGDASALPPLPTPEMQGTRSGERGARPDFGTSWAPKLSPKCHAAKWMIVFLAEGNQDLTEKRCRVVLATWRACHGW